MLLRSTVTDYREPAVESHAINKELRQAIDRVLSGLTSREQRVVKLRYGLYDGYSYTLEEMGRILHCTRERVRGIEAKAIAKLSAPIRAKVLAVYLESSSGTIDLNAFQYPMQLYVTNQNVANY